jgi:excisionase family DNA binding protein
VEQDTYTPAEAAKVLRLTKRRIIQLITQGDLEGEKDDGGRWRIPQRAVHERLGDRPPRASESREVAPGRVRELEDRVERPCTSA